MTVSGGTQPLGGTVLRRCLVVALSAVLVLGACGSGDGKDVAAFCGRLKAFRAKYLETGGSLSKSQFVSASAELETIAKIAPSSIRADAQSVSDAFDLEAAGKPLPAYRAQEFRTASDNLTKYGEKKCGIPTATSP